MGEPLEPIPPRHAELEAWTDEPQPICPLCGALVRRDLPDGDWRCDIHGAVAPELYYPEPEEEE